MKIKNKINTLTFLTSLAVAPAVIGQDSDVDSDGIENNENVIVVTASKSGQEESIQDIPMAISAIGEDDIDKRNLVGLDDFLRSIPGISSQDRGASQSSIVIRGIASDPQDETGAVGVYFGEIPVTGLGGSGITGRGGNADLKLVDINHIEVLRGPQGTLYGSGSMGGTLRIIPNKPDTELVEGMFATRYSQTGEKGGNNSMFQGVYNLPLIDDVLAVRMVAYKFENSGFIENNSANSSDPSLLSAISLGGKTREQGGIGKDEYSGFRFSTLWQPNEQLEVLFSYIDQDIEQTGIPEVEGGLAGDFQQERLGVGVNGDQAEGLSSDIAVSNLVIEYEMDWGTIVSSSSWTDYQATNEIEIGLLLAGLPMFTTSRMDTEVFSEEIRIATQFDGPLQLVAGFYYEDNELERNVGYLWSGDQTLNDPSIFGIPGFSTFDTLTTTDISTQQQAFFAEVSYQLSEKLTATIGGRSFEYDLKDRTTGDGLVVGESIDDLQKNSESGQNYKVNIAYEHSDDTLIYGQWAEGFRLGGTKTVLLDICDTNQDGLIDGLGVPSEATKPDDLDSYELGFKSSFDDDNVTLSVSVYQINWKGIPVSIIPPCQVGFTFNAGKSRSQGIELEQHTRLNDQLKLSFSASYGESILMEDIPNALGFGSKGDDLPGSSDYNYSLALEYAFTLANYDTFIRGDYTYVSEYYHTFDKTGQASGDFGQLNFKAGMYFDNIDLDVFVNNLTNEDDFTWVESAFGSLGYSRAYKLRPRTVGVNLRYVF